MYESKYSKMLTILLIVGIIIMLSVMGFFLFDFFRNNNIDKDAKDAVDKFQTEVNNNYGGGSGTIQENTIENVAPIIGVENLVVNGNKTDRVQTYKGYIMVGTIEIPSINLSCPVLQDSSKGAIEVAVGIYYGPGINKVGNTVIAGHNYRNGTFFSDNKKLSVGDKIYITDATGNKVTYIIYDTYTTNPDDSSYFDKDTQGKMEISLITCTDDSDSRYIVFARAE